MAKIKGHITIKTENCKGCDLCVEECPQDSLELSSSLNSAGYPYAVLIQDNCTGCTNCALVCPEAIITVFREGKKKPIAVISNVTENMTVEVNQ
ncbi:MAG: ferredoxin family protein [Candidatus Marinimicrobia bacterium]|jgi:2-oxoglutarate ferredoxin oxidoreductase subunit delta|nr:ferredoxin family protein [Candidatus Neomarinimicrobiota bacterium]MBT3496031.1 ferredoxin family protein [Candidatus Neomarinimicrobiota bacterium]MBT3691740.1 ferredoxin family protein [Candidatus Neomarinimicrobiota bacterium]MBT3732675.1 ferredoxin family protein [Candidatus Neomarinimicrobiota bacterium]MBT4144260.1 ferredoxin family protein [Candidatus Neomarinimicrobiota bacterium]